MIFDTVTNKLFKNLLDGIVAAGNSKKINGLTAEEVGASGARNLIPYPYVGTTVTKLGATMTDNGDGTFTLNGTPTSVFTFDSKPFVLEAGVYTLSGSPAMGDSVNGGISLRNATTGTGIGRYDSGDGYTLTLTEQTEVFIRLVIQPAYGEATNLTFKPMLELGKLAHDYMPYHLGGAEKAKDADTVDGYHASDFAMKTSSYSLYDMTDLPQNANFDDYLTVGNYVFNNVKVLGFTNCPFSDYGGILRVERSSYTGESHVKQTVIRGLGGVWERYHTSAWTQWEKVFTSTGGTIKGNANVPFAIDYANSNYSDTHVAFLSNGKVLGYIGFNPNGEPVFLGKGDALHTGNSAKVLVQNTPLTAEGSIRVW